MIRLINQLLQAIDKWHVADGKAAEYGMTKEIGYEWDDARDKMLSCADKVRDRLRGVKTLYSDGWCFTVNDTAEDEIRPAFFKSLAKAKKQLKTEFESLRDLCARQNDLGESRIDKSGTSAFVQTVSEGRRVTYQITKVVFSE